MGKIQIEDDYGLMDPGQYVNIAGKGDLCAASKKSDGALRLRRVLGQLNDKDGTGSPCVFTKESPHGHGSNNRLRLRDSEIQRTLLVKFL